MATMKMEDGATVSVTREGSGRATSRVRLQVKTANTTDRPSFAGMNRVEAEMIIAAIRESFK
jgi:hypothetical protein